jgi:hypothetical protein
MTNPTSNFFKHKCLLLCISHEIHRKDPYEATRFAWKLDVYKARQAEYILGLDRGFVRGVFKAEKWYPCTQENLELFPKIEQPTAKFTYKRFLFTGTWAEDEVTKYYMHKKVPDEYRFYGGVCRFTF